MNIPSFSGYVVLPQLSELELADRRLYDANLRWTPTTRRGAVQACQEAFSDRFSHATLEDPGFYLHKGFQDFQLGCLTERETARSASSAFFHIPQLPAYYGLLFTADRTVMDIRIVVRGDDGKVRKLTLEGERHHNTSDADWINQLVSELTPVAARGAGRKEQFLPNEYFWISPLIIEVDAQTQRSGRPIPALARYNDLVRLLKNNQPLLKKYGIYITCELSLKPQWRGRAERPLNITVKEYMQEPRTLSSEYELHQFLRSLQKRRIARAGEPLEETG